MKHKEWLTPEEMVGFVNGWLGEHGFPEISWALYSEDKTGMIMRRTEQIYIWAEVPNNKEWANAPHDLEDLDFYTLEGDKNMVFKFWFRKGEFVPRWAKEPILPPGLARDKALDNALIAIDILVSTALGRQDREKFVRGALAAREEVSYLRYGERKRQPILIRTLPDDAHTQVGFCPICGAGCESTQRSCFSCGSDIVWPMEGGHKK